MIIVLGGAGFLGQHLRSRMIAARRTFTLVSPVFPFELPLPSAFERRMNADMFDGRAGDELVRSAAVVVNLISRSVPSTFAAHPWREVPENVAPAAALFARIAKINPETKLIHASSGGTVYGRTELSLTPEHAVCAPISGYGLGKLMIEEALRFTGRTTGMPYAILRVSNPVGHFQTSNAQGIVSIALRAAKYNRPFTLLGDGQQIRDYVDADDVADAILACSDDVVYRDRTWNVGSGIGRSVSEVIDLVERITRRNLQIIRQPARPVDVPRIVLDCSLIRNELGWHAHRGLEDVTRLVFETMTDNAIASS